MHYRWLIGLVIVFTLGSVSWAGDEGAHGGDGVYCVTRPPFPLPSGFYSLDFVVMRKGMLNGRYPVPNDLWRVRTFQESLAWIESQLNLKYPAMAQSLRVFRRQVFQTANSPGTRQWTPVAALLRIPDQGLPDSNWHDLIFPSAQIPLNCGRSRPSQILPRLFEVVERDEADDGQVSYLYAKPWLDDLTSTGPLQVSFLAIHEWLRDFTEDAPTIRKINRLLHSQALVEWDAQTLYRYLSYLGVQVGDQQLASPEKGAEQ